MEAGAVVVDVTGVHVYTGAPGCPALLPLRPRKGSNARTEM
jgi:hypothetical protein